MIPLLVVFFTFSPAQTPWPSEPWSSAENLTSIMDPNGLTELSGLHWNPLFDRLYVVHGDGRLRILQLNTVTKTFSQIANRTGLGGPEGITQVNFSANEFYTVDENNYEIRKYTHPADLSSITLAKHWNLLASPSPMTNTDNTGPEGITFVPDSFLTAKGFISQATGLPYTSVKGMGGLIFIAHQDQGVVWAFDVDPNVNDSFVYVGKYKTNRTESCDLAFDRSTGLLYILHNTGSNTLEVTDLSSTAVTGGRKFAVKKEYAIPNPTGNTNIEGFAVTPRLSAGADGVSAFLCRDVESGESLAYRTDCIRKFNPFTETGTSGVRSRSTDEQSDKSFALYPNPAATEFTLSPEHFGQEDMTVRLYNVVGQMVAERLHIGRNGSTFNISKLPTGVYFVKIITAGTIRQQKLVKL